MSRRIKEQQILQILADNLSTSQPMVVHSETIAAKLEMSIRETCQIVKIMDEMGMVITDGEGQNSVITRKGLDIVLQLSLRSAPLFEPFQ